MIMILECFDSRLFGFIFPDQEKLRVGHTTVLVHIQLGDTLSSLLHLQTFVFYNPFVDLHIKTCR